MLDEMKCVGFVPIVSPSSAAKASISDIVVLPRYMLIPRTISLLALRLMSAIAESRDNDPTRASQSRTSAHYTQMYGSMD